MGFAAIFKHFSGLGFFLLPASLPHPPAGNAIRWALDISSKALKDVERDFVEAQETFEVDDALGHAESLKAGTGPAARAADWPGRTRAYRAGPGAAAAQLRVIIKT